MKFRNVGLRNAGLVAFLLGVSMLWISGCGAIDQAAPSGPFASGGVITGVAHGGQFAIYNATVNIYAAGTTGYGTGATLLATTTTDVNGHFAFCNGTSCSGIAAGATYTCPSSNPDPQIYITSIGGNTQGTGTTSTNNAAAGLIAAIGTCSSISTSTQVQLNEVTTVATVFALAQFINPGSGPGAAQIGTNGANSATNTPQAALGLNNAVAGIANLASISLGTAVTTNTYTGKNSASSAYTTATPETSKINTIADIIAACINTTSSSSSQCADLFGNVTLPIASTTSQPNATFVAPQDTIQAAYYMAVNPTDAGATSSCTTSSATTKIGCLFGLITASSPFQSALSAAPLDWTLSVNYQSVTNATSGTATTCATSKFLCSVARSAIDAYGNIWYVGDSYHNSSVGALSPTGQPVYMEGNVTIASVGGTEDNSITIDSNGNIWAQFISATAGAQIYEIPAPGANPTTTTFTAYTAAQIATGGLYLTGITADGFGNVFFSGSTSNSTPTMSVYLIPSGTTFSSTTAAYQIGSNLTAVSGTQAYGGPDSVGRVYFATNTNSPGAVVEVTPPSASITGYNITSGTPNNSVTFSGTNSFTVGQVVLIAGLTNASGTGLNRQKLTLTAVTGSSFTANTTVAATSGAVTDSGIGVVVPTPGSTAASSYSLVLNTFNNPTFGASLDNNNYLYTGLTCCSAALVKATINPAGTAITTAAGYTKSNAYLGGATAFRSTVLDGADNVWYGNAVPSSDTGVGANEAPTIGNGTWSLGEAATSGSGSSVTFTALSPASTGLVGTDTCTSSSIGCPEGGGYQKAALSVTAALSIDPSGNVWAFGQGQFTGSTTTTPVIFGNYGETNLVELVGAAVPVVTPIAVGAANGMLATKP